MANSPPLPERASLDYLRKLAKERLRAARVDGSHRHSLRPHSSPSHASMGFRAGAR